MAHYKAVLGTSHWEEAMGQTEDMLEGHIFHTALESALESPLQEMESLAEKRQVWADLLGLQPPSSPG